MNQMLRWRIKMGIMTTHYGKDRQYRISSEPGVAKGTTEFVWWTRKWPHALKTPNNNRLLRVGVLVVKHGEYTKPEVVWNALPSVSNLGLSAGIIDTETKRKPLWVEDCREVAHYINSTTIERVKHHKDFRRADLPARLKFAGGFGLSIPKWAKGKKAE